MTAVVLRRRRIHAIMNLDNIDRSLLSHMRVAQVFLISEYAPSQKLRIQNPAFLSFTSTVSSSTLHSPYKPIHRPPQPSLPPPTLNAHYPLHHLQIPKSRCKTSPSDPRLHGTHTIFPLDTTFPRISGRSSYPIHAVQNIVPAPSSSSGGINPLRCFTRDGKKRLSAPIPLTPTRSTCHPSRRQKQRYVQSLTTQIYSARTAVPFIHQRSSTAKLRQNFCNID